MNLLRHAFQGTRRGFHGPLVLSVLAEGESYGYALIQRVRELSGGDIEWTEGMLYPVLHWMEKQRMIESEW